MAGRGINVAFETYADAARPLRYFAFRALAPDRKLLGAFVFSVAVSTLAHPLPALAACGVAAVLVLLSGLPPGFVVRRLLSVNAFFALLWLLLPLSLLQRAGEEALFSWGPLALYPSGFRLALLITLKGNAIAGALIALAGTSTVAENGRGLKRLRVPEKLVALLLITHGNLALMADEYRRLFEAARLRGFVARTGLASYATYARLLGLLLARSWQHARRVEEAMRLRCFAGRFPIIPSRCTCPPAVQARNRACALALLAACCLAAAGLIVWDRLL